jgi:retron-type reverse transcriptase
MKLSMSEYQKYYNCFLISIVQLIIDGKESHKIWLERGLIQGSKLSPILYNIFINNLIESIESITKTVNTTAFLYADEVAIVSKTKKGFKSALKKAEKNRRKNEYTFNVPKCAVISNLDYTFKLGYEPINNVKIFEYL